MHVCAIHQEFSMKKFIALIAVACSLSALSGCIVVPAGGGGGHYHHGGYRYYPAPTPYYYGR